MRYDHAKSKKKETMKNKINDIIVLTSTDDDTLTSPEIARERKRKEERKREEERRREEEKRNERNTSNTRGIREKKTR